jgi:hypothetical protein
VCPGHRASVALCKWPVFPFKFWEGARFSTDASSVETLARPMVHTLQMIDSSDRHLKGGGEIRFYEIGPAMQQREKPLNGGDANKCMDSQEPERISA